MNENISVGLGELVIQRGTDSVLVAYGLGSCLGISAWDPVARVAGLLHAVLPRRHNGQDLLSTRYVDSGMTAMLNGMQKAGADPRRIVLRMAGGANMLLNSGLTSTFDIGTQNIKSAHLVLEGLSMKLANESVGGNTGRTVRMYVSNGRMTVRVVGGVEREL